MRLLATLLLVLLAGCHKLAPQRTVMLPDYGLAFQMPADWQTEENLGGLRWYARPTRAGKPIAGAYLTLLRDSALQRTAAGATTSLDAYVASKLEQEVLNAIKHTVISKTPVSVDGVPGTLALTEYASPTHQWRTLSTFVVRGDNGYTLAASAQLSEAAALEPAYRRLMASLRWLPQTPPEKP